MNISKLVLGLLLVGGAMPSVEAMKGLKNLFSGKKQDPKSQVGEDIVISAPTGFQHKQGAGKKGDSGDSAVVILSGTEDGSVLLHNEAEGDGEYKDAVPQLLDIKTMFDPSKLDEADEFFDAVDADLNNTGDTDLFGDLTDLLNNDITPEPDPAVTPLDAKSLGLGNGDGFSELDDLLKKLDNIQAGIQTAPVASDKGSTGGADALDELDKLLQNDPSVTSKVTPKIITKPIKKTFSQAMDEYRKTVQNNPGKTAGVIGGGVIIGALASKKVRTKAYAGIEWLSEKLHISPTTCISLLSAGGVTALLAVVIKKMDQPTRDAWKKYLQDHERALKIAAMSLAGTGAVAAGTYALKQRKKQTLPKAGLEVLALHAACQNEPNGSDLLDGNVVLDGNPVAMPAVLVAGDPEVQDDSAVNTLVTHLAQPGASVLPTVLVGDEEDNSPTTKDQEVTQMALVLSAVQAVSAATQVEADTDLIAPVIVAPAIQDDSLANTLVTHFAQPVAVVLPTVAKVENNVLATQELPKKFVNALSAKQLARKHTIDTCMLIYVYPEKIKTDIFESTDVPMQEFVASLTADQREALEAIYTAAL